MGCLGCCCCCPGVCAVGWPPWACSVAIEVTPASIRLRKKVLDADRRQKVEKQSKFERMAVAVA